MLGIALIAGPFYFVVYRTQMETTVLTLTDTEISGVAKWSFYVESLPAQLGWMLLVLSILGLATSRKWDHPKNTILMLTWIASCYVTFTLIGTKDVRFTVYWLPPFTYFAAGLLTRMFTRQPLRAVANVAAIVLLGGFLAGAWVYRRPYISGYAAAAKAITQIAPSGIILFDGDLPGNFIFFLRADDPHRHFLVLRKALYTTHIDRRWGSEELVHDRKGIEDVLRRNGVRFVIISDPMRMNFEVQHTLRDMLQSSQFKLLGSFPIFSTWQPDGGKLLLYENEEWAPPADKFLTIRMLTLNHDLVVPFSQFDVVDKQQDTRKDTNQGAPNRSQAK